MPVVTPCHSLLACLAVAHLACKKLVDVGFVVDLTKSDPVIQPWLQPFLTAAFLDLGISANGTHVALHTYTNSAPTQIIDLLDFFSARFAIDKLILPPSTGKLIRNYLINLGFSLAKKAASIVTKTHRLL